MKKRTTKASFLAPDSEIILIYCSIVPRDFPPHHRLSYVEELSKHFPVLFIDLPSGSRSTSLTEVFRFCVLLVKNFFGVKDSFFWEITPFRKVSFLILYIFLTIQKILFKKKILLYTTSGYWDRVYRFIPLDKSIFDCPDIHAGELEKNRSWIAKFDLVFANTKLVLDKLKQYNARVIEVASGYRRYRKPILKHPKIPNSVLFLGGISQRIDYQLMEKVIKKNPKFNFNFMGEVYLNKYYAEKKDRVRLGKWQRILKYPNVNYLGVVSDGLLDSLTPFFKVGIIPYEPSNSFNYYSNPIKIFDYLASGLNVVSTPLENVRVYSRSHPVSVGQDWEDFSKKVRLALSYSNENFEKYKNQIDELLKKESLERKTLRVVGEIKKLFIGRI
jgi:hypothetical protein